MPKLQLPKLEHIGIAVRDVELTTNVFRDVLGEAPYKIETVDADGVRTHFIDAGTARLELLESVDPSSPVARFLERRNPGLHHLAFEVDDLDAAHRRLAALGYAPLDPEPRSGADGKVIFFLHPGRTAGVLIELCQSRTSVLRPRTIPAGSVTVREAGHAGATPFVLFGAPAACDVDALARELEPSCYIVVVAEDALRGSARRVEDVLRALDVGPVHAGTSAGMLGRVTDAAAALPERVLSLTVLFDEGHVADARKPDCPVLLVATDHPPFVEGVLHLRRRIGGSVSILPDLEPDLLGGLIRRHMRRNARRSG